jgi:hypothetical protein
VDRKLPPPDFRDHLAYASSLWCVLHVYPCGINLGAPFGISLVYWLIVSNVGKLAGAAGSVFHVPGARIHEVAVSTRY